MKRPRRRENLGRKARKKFRLSSKHKNGDIQFNVTAAELKRIAKARPEIASGFALDLADREKRLGAFVIDLFPVVLERTILGPASYHYPFLFIGAVTLVFLAMGIVNIVLCINRGQTIGKYFMKIKILDYETGEIPSITDLLFVRPVFFFLIVLPRFLTDKTFRAILEIPLLILLLTDILFMFKEDRRCLHDRIAGTMVVNSDTDDK